MSAVRQILEAPSVARILSVREIVERWAEIRPLLERIQTPRRYWATSPGGAFQRFHDGRWALWALGDPVVAICAVGIENHDNGTKSLRLEQVAGHADWEAELALIEAWARAQGCVRTVLPRARIGWPRRLSRRFKVTAVYAEAPINV